MAITIPILTDFNGRGIDKGIAQFNKLETTGQKAGFLIRKAALPAAAAVGALAAGAVVAAKAAAEDAAAADKLANTLDRVTTANRSALQAVEPYISALSQQVGVADDELRPALGRLATATGDLTKSQELLGIALDVSAQTGKPLESVSTALAKAYGGNFGALNRLLPGFDQGIIKSKDFTAAQKELARLTGGAAAENANTAAGQFQRFGITLQETKESIGAALLPVLEAVLPVLQRVGKFVQENSGFVVALGAAVGGLAGTILILNGAMKAYNAITTIVKAATLVFTGVQAALNIVLAANPIGLVVTALGLLVAGIVVAYRESEAFRGFVDGLFGVLKSIWDFLSPIAKTAFDGLKGAFEVVKGAVENFTGAASLVLGAIRPVYDFLKPIINTVFDGLKQAFKFLQSPIEAVKDAVELLKPIIEPVVNFLKGLGKGIFAGIAAAFQAVAIPVEKLASAIRAAKDALEDFFGSWKKTGVTGSPFNPDGTIKGGGSFGSGIPRGASGGIVRRPTLAMIGEAGPEAVIPLNRTRGNGPLPNGMGMNITVNAGLVSSPEQVGQQIIEAIQKAQRRSGPVFAPA